MYVIMSFVEVSIRPARIIASRTVPRHIRDFSALCGAKFESQSGKCTENNKRNRPKLGRTALENSSFAGYKLFILLFIIHIALVDEKLIKNVTVLTHVVH